MYEINVDKLPDRMAEPAPDAAFQDFAIVFGPRLFRMFRQAGLSACDSEALAVTSITEISLKVHRFESQGPGSFERWVLQIGRRLLIDELRRPRPKNAPDLDQIVPTDASCVTGDSSALIKVLAAALASLTEQDQILLRLRYLEDELPYAEIGCKLGLSEGAARVRHLRALRELAKALADEPAIVEWRSRLRPLDIEGTDHECK
jgi:RNA polymerase sigma factor (sigma-70 family)